MLENQLKRFLNGHVIHLSLIKINECLTCHFIEVLSNTKYLYFAFVNVITIPSIDSNN